MAGGCGKERWRDRRDLTEGVGQATATMRNTSGDRADHKFFGTWKQYDP